MQHLQCIDHQIGGRRMGDERRGYAYACCIPERRSGKDRRSGIDRRQQNRISAIMVSADEPDAAVPMRSADAKAW
ncbi:hypothetical protein [Desulfosarcina sp.]|uniref:hypothetical protein n=1 Tax=Desulfosarcina sp. TaxID=2027861 RepID=UPI003970EAB9